MENGDALRRMQSGKGLFELERLLDRFVDELLDPLLAPGFQHLPSETPAESLDPGKTNPKQFAFVPVENVDPDRREHAGDFVLGAVVKVVIAQDRDNGDAHGG